MRVDPIKPMLKPPGTKHLKLEYDILLSTCAFIFNLRRNNKDINVDYFAGAGVEGLEARPCQIARLPATSSSIFKTLTS